VQHVFEYQPIPVHREFHRSTAEERCMFGGYGSGKSYALCAEAIAAGLEQPGAEIIIIRKTIGSLKDTTEAIFLSLLPEKFYQQCQPKRMGGHLDSLWFPNGTKYMFRGLDDWMKLKSLSVAWIFYDEVDEIDEESYVGMMSRVRQRDPSPRAKAQGAPKITRRGVVCASNPAGHNWVWERFVNKEGEKYSKKSAHFVSTSLDNPFLAGSYIDMLLSFPDPWVRRYVLCSFDDFAGAIYPDWHSETHVVPAYRGPDGSYAYPEGSFFIMGFDPGTHAGNAAVWVFYDKAKHLLVAVAEYNESGLAASVHAAEWRKIENRHRMKVRTRVADPVVDTRDRGTMMKLSDQYRRLGFSFINGPRPIETRLTALGQLIAVKRFKVTEECPQLAQQIQNYRWQDLTPIQRDKGAEAKPLKRDVDLVDAAQYIATKYVAPPKVQPNRTDEEQHAAEIHAAIRRQLADRRSATGNHDLGSVPL